MENQEIKKQNWKEAKINFIANIPQEFKIRVDGIDDDSKYCHPIIELDDDLIIRGQLDTSYSRIYGLCLVITKEIIVGSFLYKTSIPINEDEYLYYIVNNYDKIKQSLKNAFIEIEKLYLLQNDLTIIKNNLIESAVSKEINQSKLKESINKLYSVTEYIENQRYLK